MFVINGHLVHVRVRLVNANLPDDHCLDPVVVVAVALLPEQLKVRNTVEIFRKKKIKFQFTGWNCTEILSHTPTRPLS